MRGSEIGPEKKRALFARLAEESVRKLRVGDSGASDGGSLLEPNWEITAEI